MGSNGEYYLILSGRKRVLQQKRGIALNFTMNMLAYLQNNISNEIILGCGIALVIVMFWLLISIRKRGIAEKIAQKANEQLENNYKELEDAYKQLQIANEQLDEKYEELKISEERNKKLAYIDFLTGLPNRAAFTEYLEYSLSTLKKGHIISVMYIDLDNFKMINDTLGHSYGDELLIDCAERLRQATDKNDYLARFGGDEFIIMTENIINMWEYEEKIASIQKVFAQPFVLSLKDFFVTASIGVAIAPKDSDNTQTLLRNVDVALYNAKGLGKNTISFYEDSLNEKIISKMETQSELHTAITNGQFELYYQAQVDLEVDRIVGFEALVRWNHPTKGLITPDHFIELAEDTGMIAEIGAWVLNEACKQLKEWQDIGYSDLTISVNLSARQFKDADLVETVEAAITQAGICPENLELEITESIALDDITYSIDTIQRLKEIGIKFSLDDFGTGYSSMNYLKYLPVSNLKIDKSFMKTMIDDESDKVIVSTIIALARALDLDVIAEGVENSEQVSFLKEAQCNIVQGYLYSVPVSKHDADELLKSKENDGISRILVANE